MDWLLSGFVKTTSDPPIYFLPAKIDDFITEKFGYKPRGEKPVESAIELDEESEIEENENDKEKEKVEGQEKEGDVGEKRGEEEGEEELLQNRGEEEEEEGAL